MTDPAADAAIGAACRLLHLPTARAEASRIADAAARERLTHKAYLAEVLTAECDDRDSRRRVRRVLEAKFPRTKRLALSGVDLKRLPVSGTRDVADASVTCVQRSPPRPSGQERQGSS